jgi:hypothetical protein
LVGRSLFISPLCTLQAPKRSDDVHILRVMKCKNLYLSLVPPNVGSFKGIESESDYHPERSAMVMETPKRGPSTPLRKKESHHFASNNGSSMCLDPTTARSALADEKINELLHTSALWWLHGRHLLKGNFVPLSICGKLSLFVVMGAEPDSSSQDVLYENENTLSNAEDSTKSQENPVLFFVDRTTKVHLSDSVCTKQLDSDKPGLPSELHEYDDKRNADFNHSPTLGGLSKESATIKGIISFSLADQIDLPRYRVNRYTVATIFGYKLDGLILQYVDCLQIQRYSSLWSTWNRENLSCFFLCL